MTILETINSHQLLAWVTLALSAITLGALLGAIKLLIINLRKDNND